MVVNADMPGLSAALQGFSRLGPLPRTPEEGANTNLWLATEGPRRDSTATAGPGEADPAGSLGRDRRPRREFFSTTDRLVLGSTAWFFGDAWLGYRVTGPQSPPAKIGTSGPARIEQVAAFRPRGAPGLAYWRFLRPIHGRVFGVMLRQRVRRAATGSR